MYTLVILFNRQKRFLITMSAIETDIKSTFDDYFDEAETFVDFMYIENGNKFKLSRLEKYIDFKYPDFQIKKFISFQELMDKYSKYGFKNVIFSLTKNGDELIRFEYKPIELILPQFMEKLGYENLIVRDEFIFMKKKKAKTLIESFDNAVVNAIKDNYIKIINNA